jgi:hypothetical protein
VQGIVRRIAELDVVRTRRAGFPRAIRLAAAAALLAAAALAAAWFALDPGPLRRIVVSSTTETGAHAPWQPWMWAVTIDDRNRYTYRTDNTERHGSIAFAPYAQRFRAIPEIRWDLPPNVAYRPGTYFWAEGARRTVAPAIVGDASNHRGLQDFATALHDAVVADLRHTGAPRIAALNSLDGLQSVVLNGRGAMCGSCVWDLAIASTGRARATTYPSMVGMHAGTHDAAVQWTAVVAALRETRWGELDERYGTHASDVVGVHLRFRFPGRSYTIDAPDLSNAPPALLRPFACVMLLAATADWSPRIARRGLPDAVAMRQLADQPGLYESSYALRSTGHATPPPHLGACKR